MGHLDLDCRTRTGTYSSVAERHVAALVDHRAGLLPAELTAAEARLGVVLPWQLWELYRFHNGQEKTRGAVFVDGARLLGEDRRQERGADNSN
jgi:cell wall assembly regulator SMI1